MHQKLKLLSNAKPSQTFVRFVTDNVDAFLRDFTKIFCISLLYCCWYHVTTIWNDHVWAYGLAGLSCGLTLLKFLPQKTWCVKDLLTWLNSMIFSLKASTDSTINIQRHQNIWRLMKCAGRYQCQRNWRNSNLDECEPWLAQRLLLPTIQRDASELRLYASGWPCVFSEVGTDLK